MRNFLSSLFFASWLVVALVCGGCQMACPPPPRNTPSIDFSVVFDPTTVIDTTTEEFLGEVKPIVANSIAAKMQPADAFSLFAVSANSFQTIEPISIQLPLARNRNEQNLFLNKRNELYQKVGVWFDNIKANPPCHHQKTPCSDIYSSILIAAQSLRESKTSRQVLWVFSDMQENITHIQKLPKDSLQNIEVVILFAFPQSKNPKDYEPFRQQLTNIFETAKPRSLKIHFPSEARVFDFQKFIDVLRREQ